MSNFQRPVCLTYDSHKAKWLWSQTMCRLGNMRTDYFLTIQLLNCQVGILITPTNMVL